MKCLVCGVTLTPETKIVINGTAYCPEHCAEGIKNAMAPIRKIRDVIVEHREAT